MGWGVGWDGTGMKLNREGRSEMDSHRMRWGVGLVDIGMNALSVMELGDSLRQTLSSKCSNLNARHP